MKAGARRFWVFAIVAACAAVISAYTSEVEDLDEDMITKFSIASCNLTLNILRHLNTESDSNTVFSPVSIGMLLSILQQGARGNTLRELNQFLQLRAAETREGFSRLKSYNEERQGQLKWGNRCYVRMGTELLTDFQEAVKDHFRLGVEEMDFQNLPQNVTAAKINNWVRAATRGKITDLVDESMVSPDTAMLLINAIFFKGNWLTPFKKSKSVNDTFHVSENKSVKAYFMNQRGKFYSNKDAFLGVKWLLLPYEDQRFAMVFLLPTRKYRLSHLLWKLSGEDLSSIFSLRSVSNVRVRIPKFKLSGKFSLVDTLEELGLENTFSGAADFRGMVSENLQVSDVLHQANIEVDEKGSTSSAATVVQFLRMSPPNLTFTADQPFLFFLIDIENNIPLFAGKLSNPVT